MLSSSHRRARLERNSDEVTTSSEGEPFLIGRAPRSPLVSWLLGGKRRVLFSLRKRCVSCPWTGCRRYVGRVWGIDVLVPRASWTRKPLFRDSRPRAQTASVRSRSIERAPHQLKTGFLIGLSTSVHPCRRVTTTDETPVFGQSWKERGILVACGSDPFVPLLSSTDLNQMESSLKKRNSETWLKNIWVRHPFSSRPRRPDATLMATCRFDGISRPRSDLCHRAFQIP